MNKESTVIIDGEEISKETLENLSENKGDDE